jgi:hypothetical protein
MKALSFRHSDTPRYRGEDLRPTMILTSNLTFGSWDQAFAGDPVLTAGKDQHAPPGHL